MATASTVGIGPHRMEQTPTPLLGDHGHAYRRQRKRHANEEGVERHQGHVSRPSPATDDRPGTPRDQCLSARQEQEGSEKHRQPDGGFVPHDIHRTEDRDTFA
jgi:hypothetical protein